MFSRQVSRKRFDNVATEWQIGLGNVRNKNEEATWAHWQRSTGGQPGRTDSATEGWHSDGKVRRVCPSRLSIY